MDLHKKDKKHLYKFNGIILNTIDKAYEPEDDTFLVIEALNKCLNEMEKSGIKEIRVLDMGTGTGIIGLFAAKSSVVSKVVLVDKSDDAVAIAKENTALNNKLKQKCTVIKSDLFENVNGYFEIIAFNAPYLRRDPKEPVHEAEMLSGGDEGVELSLEFLKEAKSHLTPNGAVVLSASSFGNLEKLLKQANNYGYVLKAKIAKHVFFEDIIAFTFTLE
ncbi:MAG: methyltransferase [Candidatus Micrarchaeaceae archaeon]